MRYAFIASEKANRSIEFMCSSLNVSRSGYYEFCRRELASRHVEDKALAAHVRIAFAESGQRYGSPRIERELRAKGFRHSRKRIIRIMQQEGLVARPTRRRVTTTIADKAAPAAENLLKQVFNADRPNQKWTADITYLWCKEGVRYLAVVLDVYSRRVVGMAVKDTLDTSLPLEALRRAVMRRQNAPELFHSDRGSQYTSMMFRKTLDDYGIACSMSRTGNCWDNAVTESWFSTLKAELPQCVSGKLSATELDSAVIEYVETFYNAKRRHSSLGYSSPVEYERMQLKAA